MNVKSLITLGMAFLLGGVCGAGLTHLLPRPTDIGLAGQGKTVDELNNTVSSLKNDLETRDARIRKLEEDKKRLARYHELETKFAAGEERIALLEQELTKLDEEMETYRRLLMKSSEIEHMQKDIVERLKKIKPRHADYVTLKKHLKALQLERQIMKEEADKRKPLQERHAALSEEYRKLLAIQSKLKADMENTKSALDG